MATLPDQTPGVKGQCWDWLARSVYCDWVRWKVWSAASISVWQHVNLSGQIHPWDTLACCWDVRQPVNKHLSAGVQVIQLMAEFRHTTFWRWAVFSTDLLCLFSLSRIHFCCVFFSFMHTFLLCVFSLWFLRQSHVVKARVPSVLSQWSKFRLSVW